MTLLGAIIALLITTGIIIPADFQFQESKNAFWNVAQAKAVSASMTKELLQKEEESQQAKNMARFAVFMEIIPTGFIIIAICFCIISII